MQPSPSCGEADLLFPTHDLQVTMEEPYHFVKAHPD